MPSGYYTGPQYGGGGSATGGGGFAGVVPYLQWALKLYQLAQQPGAGEGIADRMRQMGASQGVDVNMPTEPGILSKKRQGAMQAGEIAANAIPVVGPAVSALAAGARQAKTASAQQQYLKRIFAGNPDLAGGHGMQSEFVPQTNFLANYAGSQPRFMQKGAEKMTGALSKLDDNKVRAGAWIGGPITGVAYEALHGLGKIGQRVLGSKAKQERRQEEIHRQNVRRAKVGAIDEEAVMRNRRASQFARAQMSDAGNTQTAMVLPLLMRLLAARQGGPPNGLR